jgi:long-chain acyl-CoA synthetase
MGQTTNSGDGTYPWLKSYPMGLSWAIDIPAAEVYQMLDRAAARFPHRPCVYFLGKRYSYAEVRDLSNRVACGLQQLGVKQGTKVGIFMPNAPFFVIFYYGILKAGGIVVNYSPLYVEKEVAQQINDSETEIMVTLDLQALYPKVEGMLGRSSLKKIIVCPVAQALPFPKNWLFPFLKAKEIAKITWNDHIIAYTQLIENNGGYTPVQCSPVDDVALLQYTGGTTGVPKGAMLTHSNIYGNAYQAALWFQEIEIEEGGERVLAALPLFHVFAMTVVMNLAITIAAEIVMMFPRFHVQEAMKMIETHRITFFPAVPTIYNMINHHPDVQKYRLSSLKACLSGGAPLPVEVKRRFEELTGCHLIEGYGLSETSPAVIVNPLVGVNKEGSIGIPLPATSVKIMSLENPDQEVPLGEKGEVCIKGPQVMKGYWKRPDETERAIRNGYFHTGDVGYMDQDGFVFLVDRIKDLIICNGYNIYPRHIEEAFYTHPAVEEVTVIGIPDSQKGEVPKAFVKLKAGSSTSIEDLRAFLHDKLSPLEMPKQIEIRDALPKTLIGKLSKKELIEEEKQKSAKTKSANA